MKSMLFALRFNELLDYVRRGLSSSPECSPLIVSSDAPNAARRFTWLNSQRWIRARGSQHSRDIITQEIRCVAQIQDNLFIS